MQSQLFDSAIAPYCSGTSLKSENHSAIEGRERKQQQPLEADTLRGGHSQPSSIDLASIKMLHWILGTPNQC